MRPTGTTPEPVYDANSLEVPASNRVDAMTYPQRARFRAAAARVRTALPGPIGDLVARELMTIEEFGWTLGAGSSGTKLLHAVEELVGTPSTAAQSATRGGFAVHGTASETK